MSVEQPPNTFQGNLGTVAWLLALPTGTMMIGGLTVFLYSLGPKQIAGMQHFASGILLAAIGWELAPSVKAESNIDKGAIILGFLVGAAMLMFVGRYDFKHWKRCYGGDTEEETTLIDKEDGAGESGHAIGVGNEDDLNQRKSIPSGLVFAVLLDGSIDGLLIGISYVASGAAGLITAIALGLEMGLLGISTTTTLKKDSTFYLQNRFPYCYFTFSYYGCWHVRSYGFIWIKWVLVYCCYFIWMCWSSLFSHGGVDD